MSAETTEVLMAKLRSAVDEFELALAGLDSVAALLARARVVQACEDLIEDACVRSTKHMMEACGVE